MTIENNKYYACEQTEGVYYIKKCSEKTSALTFLRSIHQCHEGKIKGPDPKAAIEAVYNGYLTKYAERTWFYKRWADAIVNAVTYTCGWSNWTDIQEIKDIYTQMVSKVSMKQEDVYHKVIANEFSELNPQDYTYLLENFKKYPANLRQFAKEWHNLPENLRDYKSVVLAVVSINGELLKDASEEMRKNPNVIKTAVLKSPKAIQYAIYTKENAQEYMTVATIALKRIPYLQKFVSREPFIAKFKDDNTNNDKEYVLKIVSLMGDMINHASECLKKDKEVIEASKNQCSEGQDPEQHLL